MLNGNQNRTAVNNNEVLEDAGRIGENCACNNSASFVIGDRAGFDRIRRHDNARYEGIVVFHLVRKGHVFTK